MLYTALYFNDAADSFGEVEEIKIKRTEPIQVIKEYWAEFPVYTNTGAYQLSI